VRGSVAPAVPRGDASDGDPRPRRARQALQRRRAVQSGQREWPADGVVSASVVGRGITRRLRTSADLVLVLRDGKSALLIAGHDLADLQWVAKGLSKTLGKAGRVD
jgi:hypothetical protein